MDEVVCSGREAEAVLASPDWEPPPSPLLADTETAQIRNAMARFSNIDDHPRRRAAVEGTIAAIDGFPFAENAKTRALTRLTGEQIDAVADLGFIVPTEVAATALGVAESELLDTRRDVLEIVKVIGRQEPPTGAAEESASRLNSQFSGHQFGSVPAISLLYQNHDATAALLAATVLASNEGAPRRAALARTKRIATKDTDVGGTAISAETHIVVDLESTDLEFGAGPHHCPGQRIAEQIVSGIASAIASTGYNIVVALAEYHPDGRPKVLMMKPPQ